VDRDCPLFPLTLRTCFMPIPVVCPKCGTKSSAPDNAAGKRLRCRCGEIVAIPASSPPSAPAPAPAPATAAKSSKPASESPTPSSTGSLFDVLTERDFRQTQVNPYAVSEKSGNSDAAALRTYLKDEDAKKNKAKQNQSNIAVIAVGFFIGLIKTVFLIVMLAALMKVLPQVAETVPFLQLGGIYFVMLIAYAIVDLVAGVGILMRKPWGWWFAVIGLGWIMAERGIGLVSMFMVSDNTPRLIGFAIGTLIASGLAIALINVLLQSDNQAQFKVRVSGAVAWTVAILIPLVIEGVFFALSYTTLSQLATGAAA